MKPASSSRDGRGDLGRRLAHPNQADFSIFRVGKGVSYIGVESLASSTGRAKRALVQLHRLMCRVCRGYAALLRAIGLAGRERWKAGPLGRTDR